MSSSTPQDFDRADAYDALTLAACVIGQLGALFNAMALMDGCPGSTADVQRLIGIGQEIADEWRMHFEDEAKKLNEGRVMP